MNKFHGKISLHSVCHFQNSKLDCKAEENQAVTDNQWYVINLPLYEYYANLAKECQRSVPWNTELHSKLETNFPVPFKCCSRCLR